MLADAKLLLVSPLPFPFDQSPSVLWTLQAAGKIASCEVRFVPNGYEVGMLRNGALVMSRIFASGEEALAWAEEERLRIASNSATDSTTLV